MPELNGAQQKAVLMAIDPKSPLTLRALEDHLWAAADLFRNKVSNQKDYILALLFFKRASDSHREETAAALVELEGVAPEDAAAIIKANPRAYHSLGIPERHFWVKAGQAGTRKRGPSVDMARMLRDLIVYGDQAGSLQRSGRYQRVVVGRLINCGFVLDASRAKRVAGDVLFSVGLAGETKGIATAALVAAESSRLPHPDSQMR